MSDRQQAKQKPLEGLERIFEESPMKPGNDAPDIPSLVPVLGVRDLNLFPRMINPIVITDARAMAVIQDSIDRGRFLALFALRNVDETTAEPPKITGVDDYHPVGVAAYVLKMSRGEDDSMRMLIQGLARIRLIDLTTLDPYPMARVETIAEPAEQDTETEALVASVRAMFKKVLDMSPNLPQELQVMNQSIEEPGLLADMVASALNARREEKLNVLATVNVKKRLEHVMFLLERHLDILELGTKIQDQVKGKIDKSQRDYFLREQLKAIQDELGIEDEGASEIRDLAEALSKKELPENVREAANKELNRLKHMNPAAAEYTVSLTYLDWIMDLPWLEHTEDTIDVNEAQDILDHDHFGLEQVKKRIVEYLAVRQLKPNMKGPILCFVGPPGTGKTSLGRSIARALGRNFIRMSLGGVRDEAEIRGHRRTYVGALPGRIIQGLKKAESNNPVFVLDEVDKLGADFRGDPSSALLEVLDPEQNDTFSDHYLELEFDLSKVMFIATANVLDTIPGPLRDRMEVIRLAGYTSEEKLLIAKKYLVPRQRDAHGLKAKHIAFRDAALKRIISEYTREAGLRNLEREIANVCRAVATEVAKGKPEVTVISAENIEDYLGAPRFENEVRSRTAISGVATGLAWTESGGDILFVEATAMPGKGALNLTGQLGDVMKESAQAAMSYVRSRSDDLGLPPDYFATHDLHVHVPAGAIPKDGPSAGVTLASALTSLVTDRPVRPDVAMTGEITLRGLVLPVGGIREKVLAAKRAGIKRVILPKRNKRDFDEISEYLRKGIEIHPVETIDEVLELALK